MELDSQKLAKIRALDESQIARMIQSSALTMGLSERKAKLLASQSGKLRKKLQAMSDAQLNKFASMFSEEQLKSLFASL